MRRRAPDCWPVAWRQRALVPVRCLRRRVQTAPGLSGVQRTGGEGFERVLTLYGAHGCINTVMQQAAAAASDECLHTTQPLRRRAARDNPS